MVINREKSYGHKINTAGLVLSSLYLSWTVVAKVIVDTRFEQALLDEGLAFDQVMTTPAPFTTLEWRIIGRNDTGYFDAFTPVFGSAGNIVFNHYSSEDYLLESIDTHWPVKRLHDFTHGYYKVSRRGSDILITDLRMGLEGNYVFNFKVAEFSGAEIVPVISIQFP